VRYRTLDVSRHCQDGERSRTCQLPFPFLSLQSTNNYMYSTTPTLPDHTLSAVNMEQSHSLLLTKIPPELRLIIWDHALDTKTLHFECVDSRLQCVLCDDSKDSTKLGFRHTCWNAHRFISRAGIRSIATDSPPAAQGQGRGRLSLLLTCKILYVQDKFLVPRL
jgi:hypothetical protein